MKIEDKKIIKTIKPDPLAFFSYYFFGILLIILAISVEKRYFIFVFIALFVAEVGRRCNTFVFSKEGISKEFKFIIQNTTFVEYSKIQDISFDQNIWERIFGIGNIRINTAGSPKQEVILRGVRRPKEIEELIRTYMLK